MNKIVEKSIVYVGTGFGGAFIGAGLIMTYLILSEIF